MFTNRKHLALLAYLVMEPGEYRREQLTRFVWSSGASGSIDNAFSELRAALGPDVIPPRARRIALDPGAVDTDALRLLSAWSDPEGRARAIELYQAPFLEDFNARGSAESFVRWIERTRERLDEAFRQLCEKECEEAAASGDWQTVLAVAEHGLRKSPGWTDGEQWRESAGRALHARPERDQEAGGIPVVEEYVREQESLAIAEDVGVPSAMPAGRRPLRIGRMLAGVATALLAIVTIIVVTGDREPEACAVPNAKARLADENILDNTSLPRGASFVKMWKLRNTGSCTWTDAFSLRYDSNSREPLSVSQGVIPVLRAVPPNSTYTFTVPMRAPTTPGTYREQWRLVDGNSSTIKIHRLDGVWVQIVVP